jgi:hypothetical protein
MPELLTAIYQGDHFQLYKITKSAGAVDNTGAKRRLATAR